MTPLRRGMLTCLVLAMPAIALPGQNGAAAASPEQAELAERLGDVLALQRQGLLGLALHLDGDDRRRDPLHDVGERRRRACGHRGRTIVHSAGLSRRLGPAGARRERHRQSADPGAQKCFACHPLHLLSFSGCAAPATCAV